MGTAVTDIFLSYSSKDRERVRPIRDALADAGYEIFWDQELPAGANWNRWIKERLGQARLVVVAWSRHSVESDPVIHEATIGRDAGKLVPFMIDALTTGDFPLGFFTTQAAALHDWAGQSAHKGYLDLLQAIKIQLGGGFKATQALLTAAATDIADLRARADLADAAAQAELAYRFHRGLGVEQSDEEAIRLWKRAASWGNVSAHRSLGYMYGMGLGGLPKDEAKQLQLYEFAAAHGDPRAQSNLGVLYMHGLAGLTVDQEEAVRLYRLAANKGDALAQNNLGVCYKNGLGGLPHDAAEAVRLLTSASDQGNADAQFNLATIFYFGWSTVQKNELKARELASQAAAQGHEAAAAFLKTRLFSSGPSPSRKRRRKAKSME